MKNLGIVRQMDNLGRIVIPIEFRRTLMINEHELIRICMSEDGILLNKYEEDFDFYERIIDVENRLGADTDNAEHKNAIKIQRKLNEIKELWLDKE